MKNPFSKKAPSQQEGFLRTYLDRIAPGVVKFEVDHYIFGSTYRCVWALREYPASTEAQALLRELGEKSGVTLRIYCRQVSPGEEDRIIDNANKKNKLDGSDPNKLRQAVAAESNLRDVAELVHKMHREHEPLVHCAVYLEMTADSKERASSAPDGCADGAGALQAECGQAASAAEAGILLRQPCGQ